LPGGSWWRPASLTLATSLALFSPAAGTPHAKVPAWRCLWLYARRMAVTGAGASAVDLAGLLQEAGAETRLIARRAAIVFLRPSFDPRPVIERILMRRSGLELGWRSRLCTDAPARRAAQTRRPAPSRARPWLVCQEQILRPGCQSPAYSNEASEHARRKGIAHLHPPGGSDAELEVDCVIAPRPATGSTCSAYSSALMISADRWPRWNMCQTLTATFKPRSLASFFRTGPLQQLRPPLPLCLRGGVHREPPLPSPRRMPLRRL
jgi:cation diffusion facilitator CzcD-associated flavoprotein CzcO